jgi:hypothetical protein
LNGSGGYHERGSVNIPNRSRTSFQKRQKEIARAEKQRDKAAKRLQRKLARQDAPHGAGPEIAELEPEHDESVEDSEDSSATG